MGIETLAIASLVGTVGSSFVQGAGVQQQAEANAEASMYKAAVAQINAKMVRQQAQNDVFAQQLKTKSIIGQQKAIQGASGVDVNTGSPVDVRASAAQMGMLDAITILENAERKAYGYETQAKLDTMTAENYKKAGDIGLLGSALAGATSVGDKWLKFQTAGVFG